MAKSDDAVAILTSIDASLKTLVQLAQQRRPSREAPARLNGSTIAPDSDLDSPHGDPIIKAKSPRDWNGPSMEGKRLSECPPAYLNLLAQRFDYFAEKAETEGALASNGKPLAPYNRRDAARARGWMQRLRNGWKPAPTDSGFDSSEWPDEASF